MSDRDLWAGESGGLIWRGIAFEVAYRTGIEPDEVEQLISLAVQERFPDRDWDELIEPVIRRVMDAAGLEDTR